MKTTILLHTYTIMKSIGYKVLLGIFGLFACIQVSAGVSDKLPGDDELELIEMTEAEFESLHISSVEAQHNGLMTLSCVHQANISISELGWSIITPSMIVLGPESPITRYVVDIVGPLEDTVFCEQVGEFLMVKVTDTITDNSCWSWALIEDKLAPSLECDIDTLRCNVDLDSLDFESLLDGSFDNCTAVEDLDINYTYIVEEYNCHPVFAGEMTVSWTVADEAGNTNACEQTVFFEKPQLDSIVFPADVTVFCPDANTDPENTGMPTVWGEPFDHFCGLVTFITDQTAPLCGDDMKIIRRFMVMNWCTNGMVIYDQEISIVDTLPPVVACPENLTIGTDEGLCEASFAIPDVDVTDECSDDESISLQVQISGVFGSFEPGDVVDLDTGTFVVSYIASDLCNNSDTCETILRVVDDEEPSLVCSNLSFSLGSNGLVNVGVGPFASFYTDNCGTADIDIRRVEDNCGVPFNTEFGNMLTFCCDDVSQANMVEVRVTDGDGNQLSCMVQVTITDLLAPVVACNDLTVSLDASGNAQIDVADVDDNSTDNCGIASRVLDRSNFDCDDIGTTQSVTMTVTDVNGNVSSCTGQVTVVDEAMPTANCRDITVNIGANGTVTIDPAQIDNGSVDNCGEDLSLSLDDDTFDCNDIGTNDVVLTVTDPGGNSATCAAVVTVVDEDMPECMTRDITVQLDADGEVQITANQVDDGSNDGCGQITSMIVTPNEFDCTDVGVNEVVLEITDNSGNVSTCTADVTVEDNIAPDVSCQNVTVYVGNGGTVSVTADDVDAGSTDNCAIATRVVEPNAFDCDDLGAQSVTMTVTDVNGNSANCTVSVTVLDTVPPTPVCENLTVQLDNNGEGSITAEQAGGDSFDNCEDVTLSVTPTEFDCDDIGTLMATLTVTDLSGNVATCNLQVTVEDNVPPTPECANITVSLDATGSVTIANDAVDNGSTDNCDDNLAFITSPRTFTCDDLGDNTVVMTVTDDSGNSATCTATVTVDDDTDPVAICNDITVSLGANGTVTIDEDDVASGSMDACGDISFAIFPTTFDCDDVGENMVEVQVVDNVGNMDRCTSIVTVVNDNPPIAICRDITVQLDNNGDVSIVGGDINNGSSVSCGTMALALDIEDFTCDDLGENTVVLTVSDRDSNMATCDATVTVEDVINPQASCQAITVQLDADGNASITGADIDNGSTDNCTIQSITVNPNSFDCDDLGDVSVTMTVTDQSGNTDQCVTTVTVEDNVNPVAVCRDITVTLDANGNASITGADVNDGSTDNCDDDLALSVSPNQFDCDDVGTPVTVTLTVTDDSGNEATCTATVTVTDTGEPVAECQSITVQLDADGNVDITADQIDNGSFDACGSVSEIEVSPTSFDCDDIGENTVILTVTDDSGNEATCEATVTVEDNIDPEAICQNITVQLDADGNVSITGAQVDGGSTDNCDDDLALSVNPSSFDCNDVGANTVVLTVTDDAGNSDTCEATVTVEDDTDPEAVCQNITVELDADGNVTITGAQVDGGSTDNCDDDLALSVNPSSFDCDDVGENTVVLTVTDDAGNSDTCEGTVTVEDNEDPVIMCPADQTVSCEDSTDPNDYGDATSTDNCGATITSSADVDLNSCNIGTITRTFTATDGAGNMAQCTQVITFENDDPLMEVDITCPPDITLDDCVIPDTSEGGVPEVTGDAQCFNITITFVDEMITENDEVRVERTFTIIDECQDASTGTFTCVQTFFGVDDELPVINCPADTVMLSTSEGGCDSNFLDLMPATATDNNGAPTITNDSEFADDNGADASGFYPIGIHVVTFTATDACGNQSTCSTTIEIVDNSDLDITCRKVIFQMEDDGVVEINADDGFILFDLEGCNPGDTSGYEFSFTPDLDDNDPIIVTCDSLNMGAWSAQFDIYIFSPDGDTTICNTGARVQDPTDLCNDGNQPSMISGSTYYEGNAIPMSTGVIWQSDVELYSTEIDDDMYFEFNDFERFVDYELIPFNNENHLEEVSALDIVTIMRHLQGIDRFDSPYKYIAADVNNNGQVSVTDLVEIKRLLLGYGNEFRNNTSWKFVPMNYEFADPENPLAEDYPMMMSFDPFLWNVEGADFMSIKIGDVNYEPGLQSDESEWRTSTREINLEIPAMEWKQGDLVEVPVMMNFVDLEALQLELNFHAGALEFKGISSEALTGFGEGDLGLTQVDNGTVRILWVGDEPISLREGDAIFTVTFEAKRNGSSVGAFRLGSESLLAEAYTSSNEVFPLQIGLKKSQKSFTLHQNTPNPFVDFTNVRFTLPEADKVSLSLKDATGREVYRQSLQANAGENLIQIKRSDLPTSGLLYYSLETSFGAQTRVLTVLD